MTSTLALWRVYETVGDDGYPPEWHDRIKHLVRAAAGHRCVRCGHPYSKGAGEWSPCDDGCRHQDDGPLRVVSPEGELLACYQAYNGGLDTARAGWLADDAPPCRIEAQWRILTVHHLNGNKADCRWWNLVSLCQRCHLRVQRVVLMERVWPWEHSDWFKPYVAGYYAHAYLGEDIGRLEAVERLDELLALERAA
jgi:hypothetical protein